MVERLMDLGPWELLIILVVLGVPLVLIFVAVMLVTRANRQKGSAQFAEYSVPDQRRPLPPEAVTHFHHLIADRKKIQAIKEIRILTGLGLKEAKDLADAIEAGRYHPTAAPLSERVRAFKAAGDHASAVALVRAETGMTPTEAETFIHTLT